VAGHRHDRVFEPNRTQWLLWPLRSQTTTGPTGGSLKASRVKAGVHLTATAAASLNDVTQVNNRAQARPTANIYVDGFNLYYGCLRHTTYKWLDLDALFRTLLPAYDIHRIRYFTARVSGRLDAQTPARQATYLRALRTLPNVTIHLGHFLASTVRMPRVAPRPGQARTVEVIKTEEKGSDVNLATYLLVDAFRQDSDVAVVVSNDSDLCEPIRIVQDEFHLPVGILNPHQQPSAALRRLNPAFVRPIRSGPLSASQFPAAMSDTRGKFSRPTVWS
jgi:hypothetical protein